MKDTLLPVYHEVYISDLDFVRMHSPKQNEVFKL